MMAFLFLVAAVQVRPDPNVGVVSTVVVTAGARVRPGVSVHAIYEPGAPDEHSVAVGATNALGEVGWEPLESGPVLLRAVGQESLVLVGGGSGGGGAGLLFWLVVVSALLASAGWAFVRADRREAA